MRAADRRARPRPRACGTRPARRSTSTAEVAGRPCARGARPAVSAEVAPLDLGDDATLQRLVALQRASYAVEAELIGAISLPPMHETPEQLRASGETLPRRAASTASWSAPSATGATARRSTSTASSSTRRAFRRGLATRAARRARGARGRRPHWTVGTGPRNAPARALYERRGFRAHGGADRAGRHRLGEDGRRGRRPAVAAPRLDGRRGVLARLRRGAPGRRRARAPWRCSARLPRAGGAVAADALHPDLRPVGVDHLGPRDRRTSTSSTVEGPVVEAAAGLLHHAVLARSATGRRPSCGSSSRARAASSRSRWPTGWRRGSPGRWRA